MKVTSDGSTASYYELPDGAKELQDLISHRDMNAQMGEIFRACYRYGQASHSDKMRDAKKIRFYIDAEIARLEKLQCQADFTGEVNFGGHADNKPSWDDAPEWAGWLANDKYGWCWYSLEPIILNENNWLRGCDGRNQKFEFANGFPSELMGSFVVVKESRPSKES